MRRTTLLRRNLTYYWRTNLAAGLGFATAVAVLAGALVVGYSVRASLRELALHRLGNTDYVISSSGFFREQLADELEVHANFLENFRAACPLIVLEGWLRHAESGRRASAVQVYGVDSRFLKFHDRPPGEMAPGDDEILLSAGLAEELGAGPGDAVLLRVSKPSAIPVESLHGRRDDVGRTIRLSVREALGRSALAEFSVRPRQGAVRAVFVSLARLQEDLKHENRANTVLLSNRTSVGAATVERIVREAVSLEDLGIRLRPLSAGPGLSLESDSALISDALSEAARAAAAQLGHSVRPIFSYLANTISVERRQIPYSVVTAIDLAIFQPQTARSSAPPILLNDWAAADLQARKGDRVSLDFYLWRQEGELVSERAEFELIGFIPVTSAIANADLVPEYPGITEAESLRDWDPPFPLDLGRIRDRDEDYWRRYRSTPKAFIQLETGQGMWQSRFGDLTSLQIVSGRGNPVASEQYGGMLRSLLNPLRMSVSVYAARDEALQASRGATDFGEYFLYFSFFLVVSALLLGALFFKLGIEQRLSEIGILRAMGLPPSRIRGLFLSEGFVLAGLGSILGVAGALAYAALVMRGLRTWWIGAVGTSALEVHVSASSLAAGAGGGILAAVICVVWTLRLLGPISPRALLAGALPVSSNVGSSGPSFRWGTAFGLLGVALLAAAMLGKIGQTASFFGAGVALLVALVFFQLGRLGRRDRKVIEGNGWQRVAQLGLRNAAYRPARSALCIALVASATFVIVAVDAFRRDPREETPERRSGTGGFSLMAESLLPVLQDPNTPAGIRALGLEPLNGVTFARFRVRPGDDASCLNLYQPRSPRILAATPDFVQSGRFAFQNSLAQTPEEERNPWLLLDREIAPDVVPVIADANSMTYVLHLGLGDDFALNPGGPRPVRLRLVGALRDSIFQGELIISERHFLRLFPHVQGYRFFLIDVAAQRSASLAATLEEALSDFGFDVVPAGERLAEFHRVENTYLSTFQMLGGLGLLIGTLGLSAVLLRNVLERRREMALLRAVGYRSADFALMIVAENIFLLLCGLATGTACAFLAIAPVLLTRGGRLAMLSWVWLLAAVLTTGLAASILATRAALRSPLLATLRGE